MNIPCDFPHCFIFFFLMQLLVIIVTVGADDDNSFRNCSSFFNCGVIYNVGYPFWETTELHTVVSLSLRVVRDDYWKTICPSQYTNTSFDSSTMLKVADGFQNMALLYDCVNTFNQWVSSTLHLPQSAPNKTSTLGSYLTGIEEAIEEGFVLRWSADIEPCDMCVKSGGKCGYMNHNFTCFSNNNGTKGTTSFPAYYLFKIRMNKSHRANLRQQYFGKESTTLEHLQFSLATIEASTNKFSHENSLGRGGFGQVFKGVLPNGQEIAVKRLSKSSGQGATEFKNEVLLIARLQHRNLVALLGFCVEEQEKLLVYEYVPNRSLDYFLFGSQNTRVLDWMERSKIIGGVARGILYLHEDSRLKIIHRDLKPSNILLDDDMNPKISDFGLAKMVAISECEGNTNRIVGTYGYMSRICNVWTIFEKSDVFSFGVIVLEVISGKKNTSCHDSQYAYGLISYTWKKWRYDKLEEILDSNINEVGSTNAVIKCIQLGLLCVQENPNTRPSMATVVSYLNNDSIQLPLPHEPAFVLHGQPEDITTNGSGESCSINEASMSEFFPR
ncbi:hypothetical protein K1719_026174 [Acacia pycnantha]|nr:hypothetical protein K1719_026174 [Acacia pycnantha]